MYFNTKIKPYYAMYLRSKALYEFIFKEIIFYFKNAFYNDTSSPILGISMFTLPKTASCK